MNRRTILVLFASLLASGCQADRRERIDAEEFARRARLIPGVTTVVTGSAAWTVGFDPSLPAEGLKELSDRMFGLVNSVRLPGRPTIKLIAGLFSAAVERTDVSGRPPRAPELRWVRWLDPADAASVRSVVIDEHNAKVAVQAEPWQWLRPLVDARPPADQHAAVYVEHERTSIGIAPGRAQALAAFTAIDRAITQTHATVRSAGLTYSSQVEISVDDRPHALSVIDRLLAECQDPASLQVTLSAAGESWRGNLDALRQVVDAEADLAAAVAATGANLRSADSSYTIEVADAEVLERLVELFGSPAWTPGPDAQVWIHVRGNPNGNSSSAEVWLEAGPVLADAIRSGLLSTRVTSGRGGSRQRRFDISFLQQRDVPDLTTPVGYRMIIDVLRRHSWQGEAQISLAYDDHLLFWSTAKGKTKDAYFALHGAKSRTPTGWAKDFLKAWDATAG